MAVIKHAVIRRLRRLAHVLVSRYWLADRELLIIVGKTVAESLAGHVPKASHAQLLLRPGNVSLVRRRRFVEMIIAAMTVVGTLVGHVLTENAVTRLAGLARVVANLMEVVQSPAIYAETP